METHHAVHSLTNHCVQASHPHLESSFRVCERKTVSVKSSLVRDTDRKGVEQFLLACMLVWLGQRFMCLRFVEVA